MMPTLRVVCPRWIEREFKRLAKKAFPREIYALLLGRVAGDLVSIEDMFCPEDVDEYCTESSVKIQPMWFVDAAELAAEDDCVVLGSIHSHPYTLKDTRGVKQDRVQSEVDHDRSVRMVLNGVCTVQEVKRQDKVVLQASLRLWGANLAGGSHIRMRIHSIYQITCKCGKCHEPETVGEFLCECGRLLVINPEPGETKRNHLSDR